MEREKPEVKKMAGRIEDADRANWIASNGCGPKQHGRTRRTARRSMRRRTSR